MRVGGQHGEIAVGDVATVQIRGRPVLACCRCAARGRAPAVVFRGGKHLVHERVPLDPVWAAVAGVVQFDAHDRVERLGIAEQKINVLAVDFVVVAPVFVRASDVEDVAQGNFGAHEHFRADQFVQHVEERQFGI